MDKKSILGFVLITLIITAWMFYNSVNSKHEPLKVQESKSQSINARKAQLKSNEFANIADSANADSVVASRKFGPVFSKFANKGEEFVTVETELYKAILSTQGGTIRKWTLKKYKKWDKTPTQLIANNRGNLGLTLTVRDVLADTIDTRNLRFEFDTKGQTQFKLNGKDSLSITAVLQIDENTSIKRKITFFNGKYHIDAEITMQNMDKFLRLKNYSLDWKNGLAYQEASSVTESGDAEAMVVSNGELNVLNADNNDVEPITSMGVVDFAAIKTKYFTAAIIPQPFRATNYSVKATGKHFLVENKGSVERYDLNFKMPYDGGVQTDKFRVFIGPLDYKVCEEYGLQALVNFGWRWIIRPIGEFFMMPFFNLIYSLIGNYGISILLFSVVMKLLLYPLSIKQMQSVHKMKLVNPILAKMREKYKDDSKAQQQETMKIYGEYGINPAGGCLPMVLQMPILYALWAVMSNYINLRQANFGLWITDLSLPDVIVQFPTSFMGISHLSGLALLMGVTMFIQQKMTVTDPKQKAMVYMMPIMFTLMFANFPAGLNLYYFVFNLLGILQQIYIEKYSKSKLTLEDLRKAPKKEGWMQKKMREAQEVAVAQGKIPPGSSLKDLRNQQKNNKQNPNNQRKKR